MTNRRHTILVESMPICDDSHHGMCEDCEQTWGEMISPFHGTVTPEIRVCMCGTFWHASPCRVCLDMDRGDYLRDRAKDEKAERASCSHRMAEHGTLGRVCIRCGQEEAAEEIDR